MSSGPGSIVWLASYLKSGNTWMRAMLTALTQAGSATPDLNALVGSAQLAERQFLDDWCGINSAELPAGRLPDYIRAIRLIAGDLFEPPAFVKIHDRFAETHEGLALFPAEATRVAVYLVRNPLDVAPSLAAHNASTIDEAVELMSDAGYALHKLRGRANEFLPVEIGDWSGHVLSWLDQTEVPVLVVRYEDMLADPAAALGRVAAAAGLSAEPPALVAAAEACAFERLQQAERDGGFAERPLAMSRFFRQGRSGSGQTELTAAQRQTIIANHGAVMERLGYATT